MHILQEEYTFEYVKEKTISYFLVEETLKVLPSLTFSEFEIFFELMLSQILCYNF